MKAQSYMGWALSGLLLVSGAQAAALKVEVAELKNSQGKLLIAVYGSQQYLSKPLAQRRLDASAGRMQVSLTDVPVGELAVVVIHDENDNRKLDRNDVGMPTEAYGFSNDARGWMGPPKFDQAKVRVGETGASIHIKLH
ncbi:DUF2141 domain-containing protein [Parachitinimonas caeni]|uniref:DUF2141 domain-containing protein n=1 Tax=Parachitinimonas caeni TaxID=3031301 RepID=A0ABT7E2B6_9NEIS|nr:DUF2141 domain-containing protein [Parachitinimonas caeni]MDK2126455.1 DUF2141 domain-containing protein [Parachitinimonas caeni]